MDENMLLNLALDAGEIMIANGAETHRVEDTMERILSIDSGNMPEAFVTPTGIFASVQGTLTGSRTKFKRVSQRSINLEKIARVNSMSRAFVDGKLSLEDAFEVLAHIHDLEHYPNILQILSYGIISSAFTLMFNGVPADAFAAFITGTALGFAVKLMSKHNISSFLISLFGGSIITVFSLGFYMLNFVEQYDNIIIGSIMLLVPGVAITNAVRDIMVGDFLSGTSRVLEAILTAVSIATGVGSILGIYGMLRGGALL